MGWVPEYQKTKIRTRTAASSCAIRQTVVVHESPSAVNAPRNRARVTKNPPMPIRARAAIAIAVPAPPPPATASMETLISPVSSATRPKTSSPRWSGGDFPICQSLSPIPAIVATSPENRGGVRQDQQEGNESDNQQEKAHEDVHVLDEDRGSDEPDHEEHPGVSDRGSPDVTQVLAREGLLRRLARTGRRIAHVHEDRSHEQQEQPDHDRRGDHGFLSIHHHAHWGRWCLHPVPTSKGAVMSRFIYIPLNGRFI